MEAEATTKQPCCEPRNLELGTVEFKVLRLATLGTRRVRVLQENTKTNPYVVIVTDDGRLGWVLPDNIW